MKKSETPFRASVTRVVKFGPVIAIASVCIHYKPNLSTVRFVKMRIGPLTVPFLSLSLSLPPLFSHILFMGYLFSQTFPFYFHSQELDAACSGTCLTFHPPSASQLKPKMTKLTKRRQQ